MPPRPVASGVTAHFFAQVTCSRTGSQISKRKTELSVHFTKDKFELAVVGIFCDYLPKVTLRRETKSSYKPLLHKGFFPHLTSRFQNCESSNFSTHHILFVLLPRHEPRVGLHEHALLRLLVLHRRHPMRSDDRSQGMIAVMGHCGTADSSEQSHFFLLPTGWAI